MMITTVYEKLILLPELLILLPEQELAALLAMAVLQPSPKFVPIWHYM